MSWETSKWYFNPLIRLRMGSCKDVIMTSLNSLVLYKYMCGVCKNTYFSSFLRVNTTKKILQCSMVRIWKKTWKSWTKCDLWINYGFIRTPLTHQMSKLSINISISPFIVQFGLWHTLSIQLHCRLQADGVLHVEGKN